MATRNRASAGGRSVLADVVNVFLEQAAQLDRRLMAVYSIDQHVGVALWGQHEKRSSEARAEDRLRLLDSALGARHFGGIARQEVETDLLVIQPRDRRQHAVGVGGQKDHVLRMAAHA